MQYVAIAFYLFARCIISQGSVLKWCIILYFVTEPYLDMKNGKQWRIAVAKVIVSMVESEQEAKGNDGT